MTFEEFMKEQDRWVEMAKEHGFEERQADFICRLLPILQAMAKKDV